MSNPDDTNERLAAALDRELKSLPPRRAPGTLAPRVLATLRERSAAPWWQRAWRDWPAAARLVAAAAALAFVALVGGGLPLLAPAAAPYEEWLGQQSEGVVTQVSDLAEDAWPTVGPWVDWVRDHPWYFVGMLAALYLGCVGGGTVLVRTILQTSSATDRPSAAGSGRRLLHFYLSL